MDSNDTKNSDSMIKKAPVGLAVLAILGPSLVWCAEYIGSGEVILATRAGAILGTGILWAIVLGIFLKFWIGMSGARYTVCTGEGMIDMFDRVPGPSHWAVWLVLVIQFFCAVLATGALATSAAVFMHSLIPAFPLRLHGLVAILFAVAVAWSGVFDVLKIVMSFFVLIVVLGVLYITAHVFPSLTDLFAGLIPRMPPIPEWAQSVDTVAETSWQETLPVLGWGAGGFASQVWYTYWVMGAGYGATAGRGYGKPADTKMLQSMSADTAHKIKGWCKVLYTDATLAMILGIVITAAFLICGAGILGAEQVAPSNDGLAESLATVFSSRWNNIGGFLFKLCGAVAMISTLTGQLAGWPRLLADACRITIPSFNRRFAWKIQFRMFLILFFVTSTTIVCILASKPVSLLKISSILEGLLLIALQAALVAIGLFVAMPKMLSPEARKILKPHPIFAAGLIATFLFFVYICVTQIPSALMELMSSN
jgi:Mn2+/Fe2+ NRAMP family transporter